jgi:hypothetical protein
LPKDALEDFETTHAASRDSSENYIIPDSPQAPTHDDNYLHKRTGIDLQSEALKPLNWIRGTVDSKTNKTPAGFSQITFEEEMINCLLSVQRT